jgi:hypothetical protein
MRLGEAPLLPTSTDSALKTALSKVLREIAIKVNQLADGSISGIDRVSTTVPTTGTWKVGDFVLKSNPVVAGAGGSQYVISGWRRITSGSGNVLNTDWVESRELTGT